MIINCTQPPLKPVLLHGRPTQSEEAFFTVMHRVHPTVFTLVEQPSSSWAFKQPSFQEVAVLLSLSLFCILILILCIFMCIHAGSNEESIKFLTTRRIGAPKWKRHFDQSLCVLCMYFCILLTFRKTWYIHVYLAQDRYLDLAGLLWPRYVEVYTPGLQYVPQLAVWPNQEVK